MGNDNQTYWSISRALGSAALVVVFFVLSFHPLIAQNKLLPVLHFETLEGFRPEWVSAQVVRDSVGYVWIGTINGLRRFDGHDYKEYRNIPDDPSSLSSSRIHSLLVDRKNRLCVGTTEKGVSLYDRSHDRFINFYPYPDDSSSGTRVVHGMTEDHSGNIWLATLGGVISVRLPENSDSYGEDGLARKLSFKRIPLPTPRCEGRDIVEGSDGKIIVGSDSGLFILDTSTLTLARPRFNSALGSRLHSLMIRCLTLSSDGALWLGTATEGVYYLDLMSGNVKNYRHRDGDEYYVGTVVNGVALGNPLQNQTQFVVLRTSDGGTTWEHLPVEPADTAQEIAATNSFCWIDSRHGWFGTNRSRVWRTTDGGESWTARSTGFWVDPPATARVFAVGFVDSLYGLAYHPYPYLARSTNGGVSWLWVNALLASSSSESEIAFAPRSSWVWAAAGQSILHSADKGLTWSGESLYPIKGVVRHLSAVSTIVGGNVAYTGWVVTDAGEILSANYTTTGVADLQARLPSSYDLFQNFPNPFNPSTTLRYGLPLRSHVTLTVFNILGQQVATLVQGEKEAGYHEVRFEAAGLSSGVYFYQLKAGEFVQTKKLLLVH